MKTTLIQYGDSKALVIDAVLLEQLSIDLDTPLDLSTDGEALIVTPQRKEANSELQAIMEDINSKYKHTFQRLAE